MSYVTIMQTSADNSYNDYQGATFRDHLVYLFSKTLLHLVLHTMYPVKIVSFLVAVCLPPRMSQKPIFLCFHADIFDRVCSSY